MARQAHPIEPASEERSTLETIAWSRTVAHRAAQRARLVLLSAEGKRVTHFSHPARVAKINVEQIFEVGPARRKQHQPVFLAALATIQADWLAQATR